MSKKTALLIKNVRSRSYILRDIALSLSRNEYIAEAKEIFDLSKKTALLIEDVRSKSYILRDIAVSLARSGDRVGAKEMTFLIEDAHWKSQVIRAIALELAKNGDMAGAKGHIADIKKMGCFHNAVESVLELIRAMDPK